MHAFSVFCLRQWSSLHIWRWSSWEVGPWRWELHQSVHSNCMPEVLWLLCHDCKFSDTSLSCSCFPMYIDLRKYHMKLCIFVVTKCCIYYICAVGGMWFQSHAGVRTATATGKWRSLFRGWRCYLLLPGQVLLLNVTGATFRAYSRPSTCSSLATHLSPLISSNVSPLESINTCQTKTEGKKLTTWVKQVRC